MADSGDVDEIERLQARYRDFCEERDWTQFHAPKNLAMALAAEVGEVLEVLQWLTPEESERIRENPELLHRLGEEIADVQLYLWRPAEISGVELTGAIDRKLTVNEQKYPVEKALGKATKYDALP